MRFFKCFIFYSACILGMILCSGCGKNDDVMREERISQGLNPETGMPKVSFGVEGLVFAEAETKVDAVTSLSSFKASATYGTAGSETSKWNNVTFTSDGGAPATYSADKWWPTTDEHYHFYGSNNDITFYSGGSTITATGDNSTGAKDVVCAYRAYLAADYRVKVPLTFNHIYARIGQVQVTSKAPYAVSNVSIWLKNVKTGGVYNIRTGSGQTNGTGWTSKTPTSAVNRLIYNYNTSVGAGSSHTETNDIYVVPGDYYIIATWTATKDDYTQTFNNIDSSVGGHSISLVGGKINKITATLTGTATEITFSVSVTPWGNETVSYGEFPTS